MEHFSPKLRTSGIKLLHKTDVAWFFFAQKLDSLKVDNHSIVSINWRNEREPVWLQFGDAIQSINWGNKIKSYGYS